MYDSIANYYNSNKNSAHRYSTSCPNMPGNCERYTERLGSVKAPDRPAWINPQNCSVDGSNIDIIFGQAPPYEVNSEIPQSVFLLTCLSKSIMWLQCKHCMKLTANHYLNTSRPTVLCISPCNVYIMHSGQEEQLYQICWSYVTLQINYFSDSLVTTGYRLRNTSDKTGKYLLVINTFSWLLAVILTQFHFSYRWLSCQ